MANTLILRTKPNRPYEISYALSISKVIHKAFVSVDEKGTEAAAATAVVMTESARPQPVRMSVDRPFVFAIRDVRSGALVFMGRVDDPS